MTTPTIKRGDFVTIPKGTPLRSTHPQRASSTAKRSYRVKVVSVLDPVQETLGYVYPDGEFVVTGHWRDLCRLCGKLGVPVQYGPDNPEKFNVLKDLPCARVLDPETPSGVRRVVVESEPARVEWAGTGSYWVWTDAKNVVA